MSKNKNSRNDYSRDVELDHASKINFKQYLHDLEAPELEEDEDFDIISSSNIKINEGTASVEIKFGYNGADGSLLVSDVTMEHILAMNIGDEIISERDDSHWFIRREADNYISFDSGIDGIYGKIHHQDLEQIIKRAGIIL